MPQIDENQASPAADTFPRRFAAAALDVVFVALPALLLAATSTERFSIIEQTGGRARFSVPDQLRINEIDQGLNRAMQVGDTVLTLSGTGLWVTLITLAMLTVVVFFVIPGLQSGQTPGRSLMRLPVRTGEDGGVELLAMEIADVTPETADASRGTTRPPAAKLSTKVAKTSGDKTAAAAERDEIEIGVEVEVEVEAPDTDPGFFLIEPSAAAVDPDNNGDRKTETQTEAGTEPGTGARSDSTPKPAPAEDQNVELRELLKTDFERGTPPAQVTLGDDAEYDQWTDLDDLDLVDRDSDVRHKDRSFETLTLPESSLSETPLTASTGRTGTSAENRCATATVSRDTETRQEAPTAVTPEWSEELQSWVYRDEATDRWFRHDQDTNRWVPTNG